MRLPYQLWLLTNFSQENIFLLVCKELHVQKYMYYMHLKLSKVLKVIQSKSKIKQILTVETFRCHNRASVDINRTHEV